jgi:hypothetical protein
VASGGHRPLAAPVPLGARLRARALSTPVLLSALVLASAIARFAIGLAARGPVHFPDELVYSELARSFEGSGRFTVRDAHWAVGTYAPLYDVLVSPAYLLGSLGRAYLAAKGIGAVLFSLAAVPAYLLARRVVTRRSALVAAALTLLVPSGVYTTNAMPENAAYPAFLLAVLAMAAALERPSTARELAAIAAVGLAALARIQLVALVPVLPGAIVLLAWREARGAPRPRDSFVRSLRAYRVTWLAVAGLTGAGAFLLASRSLLGAHAVYVDRVHPLRLPAQLAWHLADLDLYSGVVPFVAFLLVCGVALGPSACDRRSRMLAALGASTFVWVVLVAAVFGTAFKVHGATYTHVFDRYVFYVVPLFVIALLVWVERGLSRPRAPLALLAVVAAVLPATLPFAGLLGEFTMSSVGLVPWLWTSAFVGRGWGLTASACSFAAALALTVLRASNAWSLVRISAALFVLVGFTANVSNAVLAGRARDAIGSVPPSWVDERVGPAADVALIWKGKDRHEDPYRLGLKVTEFFNRSIGPIYELEDPLIPGLPSRHVTIRGGRVVREDGSTVRAAYVVAGASLRVRGTRIAGDPRSGIWLYRVPGTIRLANG